MTVSDAMQSQETSGSALGDALGLSASDYETFKPALAEALQNLGLDGTGIVDRLEAGQSLSDALALPAGFKDILYARAHNWFNVGRYDKAESLFRTLCVLDGKSRDHWLGYGICLKVRGQAQPAETALRVAAEVDRSSSIAYYHLLDLAMRQGDWQRAAIFLAAFDARGMEGVPAPIAAEVQKYRTALPLKHGTAEPQGPA